MMISRMLAGAVVALALCGAAQAQGHQAQGLHAPGLGDCAWSNLSGAERSRVIEAYQRDASTAETVLRALDPQIQAAAAHCMAYRGTPASWVQAATGAEAIQASMAAALLHEKNLDRKTLDAAWTAAPADAKACIRAAAAKSLGLPRPACAHPKASAWLLRRLGIPAGVSPVGRHAYLYFTAKAHTEYIDKRVAKFAAGGAQPAKTEPEGS
jgi:hypothetical protein